MQVEKKITIMFPNTGTKITIELVDEEQNVLMSIGNENTSKNEIIEDEILVPVSQFTRTMKELLGWRWSE